MTPPAELFCELPRPVRLTAAGKFLSALLILLAFATPCVGIFTFGASYRESHTRTLLREQGDVIAGNVTRVWETGSRSRSYGIEYRFNYGSVEHRASVTAPFRIWSTLRPREKISILVLPADPTISHPAAWESDDNPLVIPCIVVPNMALWCFGLWSSVRLQYQLLSNGLPALGRVTGCHRAGKRIVLICEFRIFDGTIVKTKYNNAKRRTVGTPVCILYDRDTPRRNAIYPLSLVRVG
jgi:hypothetical protein